MKKMLVMISLFLSLCNGAFAAVPTTPYKVDAHTLVLYHFDDSANLGLDATSNLDAANRKLNVNEEDVTANLIKYDANGAFGGAASFEGYNLTSTNLGNEAWLRNWRDQKSVLTPSNWDNGFTFEMMLKPDQRKNPMATKDGGSVFLGQFGNTLQFYADYKESGVNIWTLFRAGYDVYLYSGKLFPYGKWGHFAFTFDKTSGKAIIWVNGENAVSSYYEDREGGRVSIVGSPNVKGWNLNNGGGTSTLVVGNMIAQKGNTFCGRALFSGLIDEVRISDIARDFNTTLPTTAP